MFTRVRAARTTEIPIVTAVVLGTLALRLYGLEAKPLWIDEAYSLERAREPLQALWVQLIADHLPAYFALLWVSSRLTGEAEWALRLPSVLVSTSVALALPLIGSELGRPRAGIFAAVLFAFSPFVIFWSQEAKPEAAAMAIATWSTYLLLLARRRDTRLTWLVYGAASLLGLYTFYYNVFIFAAHNVAFIADCLRRRTPGTLARWLVGQAALLALFAPWPMTHLIGHMDEAGFPPLGSLSPVDFLLQMLNGPVGGAIADTGSTLFGASPATLAGGLLALLCLVGAARWGRLSKCSFQWTVLVSWLIVPVVGAFGVQLLVPSHEAYYLLPVVPSVLLLASIGLSDLARSDMPRRIVFAVICVVLATLWASLDAFLYGDEGNLHAGWRDAAVYFVAHRQPGEVLIADPAWQASTLAYYLPDADLLGVPDRPPTRPLACLADARHRGVPGVWVASTAYAHVLDTARPIVSTLTAPADLSVDTGGVTLTHYPFDLSTATDAVGPYGWGDFLIQAGAGSARLGSPGTLSITTLCDEGGLDMDIHADIRTDKWPSAGNEFVDLLVRWNAPDTSYLVRLRFDAAGGSWLQAGRWMHDAAQLIGPEVPVLRNTTADPVSPISVRAQVVGQYPTHLRLKAWEAGQPEPIDWNTELTEATPELQTAGAVAFQAFVSTRATNTPVTISFQDIGVSTAG